MILENTLRKTLKTKPYALGAFVSTNAPSIVEVLAIGGLDFVIIDMEHAPFDFEDVVNMIRAAEIYNISAVVRITDYDPKVIGRLLDIGAHGIQAPMVHTAKRASEVVRAAKYPPLGERGMSNGRGPRWGSIPDYRETSNRESLTICMCETKEAVDNMPDIVKTPGLDVVFVGASDLSQSLGCPREYNSPLVEECVVRVERICREEGVIPGIVVSSVEDAKRRIDQGFRYVTVLNDMQLLYKTTKERVDNIRAICKDISLQSHS